MPYSDQRGATVLAERFREAIDRHPLTFGGMELTITGSFGVSSLTTADTSPLNLLDRADQALYDAKAKGGNLVMSRADPPAGHPVSSTTP
jgi:diguanylate cyclase (GGDEF)-like protein